MQQKVTALRQRLADGAADRIRAGADDSHTRIEQAIAPYSRFVRAEHSRWTEARTVLAVLRDRAGTFRERLAA